MLAGAQQTGTVNGTSNGNNWTYNYSGQLLFPARALATAGKCVVRILGASASPMVWWASIASSENELLSPGQSCMISTATAGSVIDVIPDAAG